MKGHMKGGEEKCLRTKYRLDMTENAANKLGLRKEIYRCQSGKWKVCGYKTREIYRGCESQSLNRI